MMRLTLSLLLVAASSVSAATVWFDATGRAVRAVATDVEATAYGSPPEAVTQITFDETANPDLVKAIGSAWANRTWQVTATNGVISIRGVPQTIKADSQHSLDRKQLAAIKDALSGTNNLTQAQIKTLFRILFHEENTEGKEALKQK